MSTFSQSGKFNKKLNYNFTVNSVLNTKDVVAAVKYFPKSHTHFLLNGLISKDLSKGQNVGVGYTFGRHDIFKLRENEHRYVVQTLDKQKFDKVNLVHRLRFEYRRPTNLKTNITSDAAILRYQLGGNYFFDKYSMPNQGPYLNFAAEAFFYMKGATNGPVSSKNGPWISEAWSNIGLGFAKDSKRFELGYGYQRLVRNPAQDLRVFRLCQATFSTAIKWDNVLTWYY